METEKDYQAEVERLQGIINHEIGDWDKSGISYQEILDMKNENESLKQRIEELESRKTIELPFDPLKCANYLINATYERETSGFERALYDVADKVSADRYDIDDLEQIAEHLLVYCKHNRSENE